MACLGVGRPIEELLAPMRVAQGTSAAAMGAQRPQVNALIVAT